MLHLSVEAGLRVLLLLCCCCAAAAVPRSAALAFVGGVFVLCCFSFADRARGLSSGGLGFEGLGFEGLGFAAEETGDRQLEQETAAASNAARETKRDSESDSIRQTFICAIPSSTITAAETLQAARQETV